MPTNGIQDIENRLWSAADELRANSKLKASEYSVPVLGLIFLRYADFKFSVAEREIQAGRAARTGRRRQRPIGVADYQARGLLYIPDEARYKTLLELPEGENIGQAISNAMKAVEAHNPDLKDVLPKTYNRLNDSTLISLLKTFHQIEMDIEGDVFGKIYEYFLGKFAMSEGQRGGEFFTPTSIVKLIVEIIEPFGGRVYDPACGSGGMFVQSASFVQRHKADGSNGGTEGQISVYGQERVAETVRLCQMNLAVHGLSGDVRQANTYYEDLHTSVYATGAGKFDYVMANPPFNVNNIDKDRIEDDPRFPFGLPTADNGNYVWIQVFYSALNGNGRAGFVMANSASDARGSELEIRKKLVQSGAADVMVAVASNFFYTVALPCTLWFLDRGKEALSPSPPTPLPVGEGGTQLPLPTGVRTRDTTLFIDARQVYTQIDRAHREYTPAQIEFLANIVRLYRGRMPETAQGSEALMEEHFPDGVYRDVPGLCKVATLDEIEAQGWSLNPGRYVGVAEREEDPDFDFAARLTELHEELEVLNSEAHELEMTIRGNVLRLLDGA